MTNTVKRSLLRLASITVLFPVFILMLFGLPASNANAGTITLISKPMGDHGERRCSVDIPAAGAGKTLKLSLADRGGIGIGNCYDMQPTEIIMQDIPSAAEFLLTDDWLCNTDAGTTFYTNDDPEDNKSFVIRLETTRNLSQLPEIGIDRLVEFEKGKYLDYVNENQEKPIGFRLVDKSHTGEGRITRKLSCLEIKISEGEVIPELKAVALGGDAYSKVEFASNTDFKCPENYAMTRRKHSGDEMKKSTYYCNPVVGNGTETILRKESFVSAKIPECGRRKPDKLTENPPEKDCKRAFNYDKEKLDFIYLTCPTDSVMIGRWHMGDENDYTKYTCAEFYIGEIDDARKNRLIVEPDEWEEEQKESNSDIHCGIGKVMIGRAHKADENGPTRFRCGTLYYPINAKSQVTP
ncbi:hypothetical protein [Pseudomonas sp. LS.1a]|uniref:hypothetical protein n=1 Tax=Pseudomonas sp. LS.1a TaxID=2920387 RepID=UPI001F148D1B|nr:hypothetical protein [Pseudomonas sp. LS.1a]UMY63019.1 hypothetical protein MKK04_07155 [Pseudomonas sp. LS.1a]